MRIGRETRGGGKGGCDDEAHPNLGLQNCILLSRLCVWNYPADGVEVKEHGLVSRGGGSERVQQIFCYTFEML